MHTQPTAESRWSAGVFLAFFVSLMVGWLTLMSVFDFPDILRAAPEARFTLFQAREAIIVPAYYALALSSALQLFMAVAMYRLVGKSGLLDLSALAAGVAGGIFQMLGFFRWVILIPALSRALAAGEMPADTVFAFERFANTYLGMTVGEHLGSLLVGLWMLCLGVRLVREAHWGKALAWLALASALALLLTSLENLGPGFAWIGVLTAALWGLYLTWVLLMAVAFLSRRAPGTGWWIFGGLFYLGNVLPSFL